MTRLPALGIVAALAGACPLAAQKPIALGTLAGPPRRCIFPDRSVPPRTIDGTAIIYHDQLYTYVARFKGGCPALREDRIAITRGNDGELCANDPVRIVEPTGAGFGFCTFESFTPYRAKRKGDPR